MKFWFSAVSILIIDQLTKIWVMNSFIIGQSKPLIDNVFWLTYVLNPGAAFGMMAGKSWLFLLCAGLVVAVMIIYNAKYKLPQIAQISMGLIVGGSIGNFIDRIQFNAVRDFFDLGWWPVFNVADMGIVGGGILLMIYVLMMDKNEEA